MQMFDDPFFRKFFGEEFSNQFKQNRAQRSLGSGVIVTKDGYIVTNNHVIENAEEINVTIGDDPTEYSAKLIGKDSDSDLAVVKIDINKPLVPIKLGDSSSLLVGDVTFAIGNPFGVGNTVTMGIISALNKNRVGINRYENYIQTDASINPGNSGGALVDSRGALIGINTAILSKSGGNDGIGFAIPVEMVKDVVGKLVSDGKVIRGYLGVVIVDLDKDSQQVYKRKEGAIILDISNDTPAAKYGLKRGDLVYAINGKETKDRNSLQNAIASFKPNEKVTLQIERDKKDIVVEIVLADRSIISGVQPDSDHTILNGLKVSPNWDTDKQPVLCADIRTAEEFDDVFGAAATMDNKKPFTPSEDDFSKYQYVLISKVTIPEVKGFYFKVDSVDYKENHLTVQYTYTKPTEDAGYDVKDGFVLRLPRVQIDTITVYEDAQIVAEVK